MSAFVQVLNEQVQRGELRRQAQHAAPVSVGSAGPGQPRAPQAPRGGIDLTAAVR